MGEIDASPIIDFPNIMEHGGFQQRGVEAASRFEPPPGLKEMRPVPGSHPGNEFPFGGLQRRAQLRVNRSHSPGHDLPGELDNPVLGAAATMADGRRRFV